MSESPYAVGYGRPPVHSQFKKGQSGNPGGKPRAQKQLLEHFEIAVTACLNVSEGALRSFEADNVIESFARKLVLQAVEGRTAAQKLVLAVLEGETRRSPASRKPSADTGDDDDLRELPGGRFDAFKAGFDKAVAAGSLEDLLGLADEFETMNEFPETGNFSGKSEKTA